MTLRAALLCFLLVVGAETCFAQKISQRRLRKHREKVYASKRNGTVILSLDTIFNKGLPYAILVKKKQLPYHQYTLYALNRKKLITIESKGSSAPNENGNYAFHFTGSGQLAEPGKYITFQLEKEIVAYYLVENNEINPFGELKFLRKYNRSFSDSLTDINKANIYKTVPR